VTIRIFVYVTPVAAFREERVALNGEQPRPQKRAFPEAVEVLPRFQQRVLHQIVGAIGIAGKGKSEGSEIGYQRQQSVALCWGLGVRRSLLGLGHLPPGYAHHLKHPSGKSFPFCRLKNARGCCTHHVRRADSSGCRFSRHQIADARIF